MFKLVVIPVGEWLLYGEAQITPLNVRLEYIDLKRNECA
jgi:hypothetical protein